VSTSFPIQQAWKSLVVPCGDHATNSDIIELSLDEIFNGKESAKEGFPGIIPSVKKYLNSLGCDSPVKAKLSPYLELISKRAAGTLPTAAQWMRNYVKSHPEYISKLEELLHDIDTNQEINDIDKIYEKIVKSAEVPPLGGC
jgi:glutamate--cysteine ligase catalytic subunit